MQPTSLAQYAHANFGVRDQQPLLSVGNSFASPLVAATKVLQDNGPNWTEFDQTYLLNAALWDGFFLSSVAPWMKTDNTTAALPDHPQFKTGNAGSAASAPANQVKSDNQQTAIFPPGIGSFELDEDAREIFIADGFLNKRILVYDLDTGAFKRGWGGKGIPLSEIDNNPTPPYDISGPPPDSTQFVPALHCIHFSRDGLVYVCERGSDRVQVFTKQGKFVSQFFVHPSTQARGPGCGGPGSTTDPGCGTVYHLVVSSDRDQRYVFVADGTNNMIWIHNRKTGALEGSFGGNGRYAGMLHWVDAIVTDSRGNVYTGEVEDGKRVQKFVPQN